MALEFVARDQILTRGVLGLWGSGLLDYIPVESVCLNISTISLYTILENFFGKGSNFAALTVFLLGRILMPTICV